MLYIVLPAYNEAQGLPPLLEAFQREVTLPSWRALLVNDGSTDGTEALARQTLPESMLMAVRHSQNQGLGCAIQSAFQTLWPVLKADDTVVTMDADNSHPVSVIPLLLGALTRGAYIAIASRFCSGSRQQDVPWYRQFLTQGASTLLRWITPYPGVRDYTSGYRAYQAALLLEAKKRWGEHLIHEKGFAGMTELLLKLLTLSPRVTEVPLELRYDRKRSPSKMPIWTTAARVLWIALTTRQRIPSLP